MAVERARKRTELLTATETALAPTLAAVTAGRLTGAENIGVKIGKIIDKYKMAKHFDLQMTDTTLAVARKGRSGPGRHLRHPHQRARRSARPRRRGHRLQEPPPRRTRLPLPQTDDLDLRPIHHRLEDRVRAHVLICMLAAYLVWHLRTAWAPLTYTEEHPTTARQNPVAPARRSASTDRKSLPAPRPQRPTRPQLPRPARPPHTLTGNDLRYSTDGPTVPTLAEASPTQRRAFDLIGAPIPHTLT
jgi:hypothetical protein